MVWRTGEGVLFRVVKMEGHLGGKVGGGSPVTVVGLHLPEDRIRK